MKKSDVRAMYHEVKRQKASRSNSQGLMEARPKKSCNCGGAKKRAKG